MSMSMIRAVIVDFDGTLCDTRRAISAVLVETFRARGQRPPEAAAIDATLARGITLEETFAELDPELANRPGECHVCVKLYREIYNGGLGVRSTTAFPGAADALAALAVLGVPVVIASNKGERAVEGTLRHLELDRYIHAIVAASGTLATKPDPSSFETRIAPLFPDLEPADFLMTGDTPTDLQYARAIGARSAWVSFGYGAPEACRALGPDHVVDTLSDLAALVECAREATPAVQHDAEVCILDAIGRRGPASAVVTYLRAFCQPDLPRARAQALIARITHHLLGEPGGTLVEPDLLVPIARAGMAMWSVANTRFGSPASCFAIARKDKAAGTVEAHLSSGLHGGERSALVLDTVSATGDTIIAVAEALRRRCPECRIEAAICYASPQAVDAIARSPVVDHLRVGTLAAGVEDGWLLPRTHGDVGDKLYGPGPTRSR
jgi:phosphoglycolate phosphatase